MQKNKQKVAFFDIDGTIFRWTLFIEYFEELIQREYFPKEIYKDYLKTLNKWQNREGDFNELVEFTVKAFYENIKGVHIDDFKKIVEDIIEIKGKKTYKFTSKLLKILKNRDYFTVAISFSSKIAVDEFSKIWGFDKVYGVMYEKDDKGYFTGNILNENEIFDKSKIVEKVFRKHPELTKDKSIAVGDTKSDIPMLSSVEIPIAFNPDKILFKHSIENGWITIVERKNVIYKINSAENIEDIEKFFDTIIK